MNDLKTSCQEVSGLQLHYTSSRYGLSGHPGFQTRAMSSKIRPEEQRAIERLGIYQPPRDCSVEPDQAQINELFPVAYRSTYLETGRLALVRSVYVGQDYTGRWGNYFAHALLFDKLSKAYWPIDLYEWGGWVSGLYENDDIEQATYQLPVISYIPDKSAFSFTELQEFLKEEDGRQNSLREMIQAIFLRKETSRSLVIREEIEANGLFWIACLQKSFPTTCQSDLGCSSYQFDPRACLEINVIHGETDFSLGENERKYQFYVFDFINATYSSVGDSHKEYALLISKWMHEHPERLEAFYTFSELFTLKEISYNLLLTLRLYRLSIGDELALGDADLIDILSFVNSSARKECLTKVLGVILSSIRHIVKSQNPDYIVQLALLFVNGAEQTGEPKFRGMAYQLILKLVDNCIFEKGISISQLDFLRSRARLADQNFDDELSKLFLSDQHLSEINASIHKLDEESMSYCLNELISALRVDKNDLIYDKRLRSYIEYVISFVTPNLSEINWLFLPFEDSVRSQSELCVYICEMLEQLINSDRVTRNKYNSAISSFSLFLYHLFQLKGDTFRFEVINIIKNNAILWRLLEEEYRQGISKEGGNSVVFYNKYYLNALNDESEFAKEFRSIFAEILWDSISNRHKLLQAVEWIKEGHVECFSDQLLSAVFNMANKEISFDPRDSNSDSLSKMIDDKIVGLDLVLRPNRSLLRRAILLANNKKIKFEEQPIDELKSALCGIDRKTFAKFTNLYLPRMMMKVTTPEQHGEIIKEVILDRYNDIFLKSYQRFLNQGEASKFNTAEMSALKYWISLTTSSDDYDLVKDVRVEALDLLVMRLARLKDKPYKAFVQINTEDENITRAQRTKLKEIYRQVEEIKDTFIGRVRRFLSKDIKEINLNWRSKNNE